MFRPVYRCPHRGELDTTSSLRLSKAADPDMGSAAFVFLQAVQPK